MALEKAGIDKVKVRHKLNLLSDNGPGYISRYLKALQEDRHLQHIHSAPFHPMPQRKIECYHRSMKNVL
jgi:putative transposase